MTSKHKSKKPNAFKKKVSSKFVEFKEKEWLSDHPKPHIEDAIWGRNGAEDLAFYIDWHKRHPHCNSPRIPQEDMAQQR